MVNKWARRALVVGAMLLVFVAMGWVSVSGRLALSERPPALWAVLLSVAVVCGFVAFCLVPRPDNAASREE